MKKKFDKGPFIALLILLLVIIAVSAVYMANRNSARGNLARRIAELGPENGNTPSTIEGLRSAIGLYENEIEQYLNDAGKTGFYWKILVTKLQDKDMHGPALEALERAIFYYPEDSSLHYMLGISAGYMAKDSYGTQKTAYYATSEKAYLRSIEIDPQYSRPYYGIGVLYVFELNRPGEAIPYLEKYIYELRKYDVDALFVLARAYYMVGDNSKALNAYDEIIKRTRNDDRKAEAMKNKQIILDAEYGQ